MSKWYELKEEDIDFSIDGSELHALIDSDDSGNIYVSFPIELLQKLIDKHTLQ